MASEAGAALPRFAAVGNLKDQVPDTGLAIAAQDIALDIGGVECCAHYQPIPNFSRTCATE